MKMTITVHNTTAPVKTNIDLWPLSLRVQVRIDQIPPSLLCHHVKTTVGLDHKSGHASDWIPLFNCSQTSRLFILAKCPKFCYHLKVLWTDYVTLSWCLHWTTASARLYCPHQEVKFAAIAPGNSGLFLTWFSLKIFADTWGPVECLRNV